MEKYAVLNRNDVIDPSTIYTNPELKWTWSYSFPKYSDDPSQVVTEEIAEKMSTPYTHCWDAYGDMLYWGALVYGDLYGNRGIHTSLYYLWNIIMNKLPQWVSLCSKMLIGETI